MSEKQLTIHNAFCDYMIHKATKSGRILTVKPEEKKTSGIIRNNYTNKELKALFEA